MVMHMSLTLKLMMSQNGIKTNPIEAGVIRVRFCYEYKEFYIIKHSSNC